MGVNARKQWCDCTGRQSNNLKYLSQTYLQYITTWIFFTLISRATPNSSLQTTSGSPYLFVFPPNSVCLDKAAGASSGSMISSTNCIFSAFWNVSFLRRASNSALVLTVYETVASLSRVKVFRSWVYSLRRLKGRQWSKLCLRV